MNGCVNGVYRLSCSCCLGGGPGIEVIRDGPPCPCMVKKVLCNSGLIFSLRSGRGGPGGVNHVKITGRG